MELKSYAAKTDQGPAININEDCYEVDLVNNLFLLFDGYGGLGIGDKCVNNLKENIKSFYTQIGGDQDATLPFFFSPKYLIEGNALINAAFYAHKALFEENQEKASMDKRAGASAVMASMSENILTLVNTGNCVGHLYRRGNLEKIVQEDSMRLFGNDDYDGHFRSCPLSGFGLFEILDLKSSELKLYDSDIIIFMSDGAYSRLGDDEIKHILSYSEESLSEKINNIFNISNARGNLDNQTSMILQF